MIETLDENQNLKFEHGPTVKFFEGKGSKCLIYHSISNTLLFNQKNGIRSVAFQSFLQLYHKEEEIEISGVSDSVLKDSLYIPDAADILKMRLSSDELLLAIETDCHDIHIVEVTATGQLIHQVKECITMNEPSVIDMKWTLSRELLCLTRNRIICISSSFFDGWKDPNVNSLLLIEGQNAIGVVGEWSKFESDRKDHVNAVFVASNNPINLCCLHPSGAGDFKMQSISLEGFEGDVANLLEEPDFLLEDCLIKGLISLDANGIRWAALMIRKAEVLSPDVIVVFFYLNSDLTQLENVYDVAFNEIQWEDFNALDDVQFPMIYLDFISTLFIGSPKLPDLAILSNHECITTKKESYYSIRPPESHQLSCAQIDFDESVGCIDILIVPQYIGDIYRIKATVDTPPLSSPPVILLVQTDGNVAFKFVDCFPCPVFPLICPAIPFLKYASFSMQLPSSPSAHQVEEDLQTYSLNSCSSKTPTDIISFSDESIEATPVSESNETSKSFIVVNPGDLSSEKGKLKGSSYPSSQTEEDNNVSQLTSVQLNIDLDSLSFNLERIPHQLSETTDEELLIPKELVTKKNEQSKLSILNCPPTVLSPSKAQKASQISSIPRPRLSQTSTVLTAKLSLIPMKDEGIQSGLSTPPQSHYDTYEDFLNWIENERYVCKGIIEEFRSRTPGSTTVEGRIGGVLGKGLSAFEDQVQRIEEKCMSIIPPKWREDPLFDLNDNLSEPWIVSVAPGIQSLEKRVEEIKATFESFQNDNLKKLLTAYSKMPEVYGSLENRRQLLRNLIRQMLYIGRHNEGMRSKEFEIDSVPQHIETTLKHLMQTEKSLSELMDSESKLIGTPQEKRSDLEKQGLLRLFERVISQACQALDVLEDSSIIDRTIQKVIAPEVAYHKNKVSIRDSLQSEYSKGTEGGQRKRRYGLNYEEFDNLLDKKTDGDNQGRATQKTHYLQLNFEQTISNIRTHQPSRLRISADELDADGSKLKLATTVAKQTTGVDLMEGSSQLTKNDNSKLDAATLQKLEQLHDQIKTYKNTIKKARLNERLSQFDSNFKKSLSTSLVVEGPTEGHLESTNMLQQVYDKLADVEAIEFKKKVILPNESFLHTLAQPLNRIEEEACSLQHQNANLLLDHISQTLLVSRSLQTLVEESSRNSSDPSSLVIEQRTGQSLANRIGDLQRYTASRKRRLDAHVSEPVNDKIVLGFLKQKSVPTVKEGGRSDMSSLVSQRNERASANIVHHSDTPLIQKVSKPSTKKVLPDSVAGMSQNFSSSSVKDFSKQMKISAASRATDSSIHSAINATASTSPFPLLDQPDSQVKETQSGMSLERKRSAEKPFSDVEVTVSRKKSFSEATPQAPLPSDKLTAVVPDATKQTSSFEFRPPTEVKPLFPITDPPKKPSVLDVHHEATPSSLFGAKISTPKSSLMEGPKESEIVQEGIPKPIPNVMDKTAFGFGVSGNPFQSSHFSSTGTAGISSAVPTVVGHSAIPSQTEGRKVSLFGAEARPPTTLGSASVLGNSSLFGQQPSSSGLFGKSVFERKEYSFGSDTMAVPLTSASPSTSQPASLWGSGFSSFAKTDTRSMEDRAKESGTFGAQASSQSNNTEMDTSGANQPQPSNYLFGNSFTTQNLFGQGNNQMVPSFGTPSTTFGQLTSSTGLFTSPKTTGAGAFRVPNKLD